MIRVRKTPYDSLLCAIAGEKTSSKSFSTALNFQCSSSNRCLPTKRLKEKEIYLKGNLSFIRIVSYQMSDMKNQCKTKKVQNSGNGKFKINFNQDYT